MPEISSKPAVQTGPVPEDYLTKRELAQRLRKTVRTIDNWMKWGFLPYYKVGRCVAFRLSDVQAHLDANYRVCRRSGPVSK